MTEHHAMDIIFKSSTFYPMRTMVIPVVSAINLSNKIGEKMAEFEHEDESIQQAIDQVQEVVEMATTEGPKQPKVSFFPYYEPLSVTFLFLFVVA